MKRIGRRRKNFSLKIKTKAFDFIAFSARVAAFFMGCFLGMGAFLKMAESGSDFFYYAMAFARPGSTAAILSEPFEPEEEPPLSTVFEEEENGAQNEAQAEISAPDEPLKAEKFPPEIPESRRGQVTETQYSASEGGIYVAFGSALIKNCTSHSAEKIKTKLSESHSLSLSTESEKPQVLIYHTHATEGYEAFDTGVFDVENTWRSTDKTENMVAVGEALSAVLTAKGIGVIHDETLHDDPGYNGSYGRSAVTIKEHMEENPSLTVFLDLHRDAIEPSEKEIIKPTAVVNGKKAAQIMIISGCDNGKMNMPDYWKNLRFAAALASRLEELYPGITRPVLFDYRKYNMDLSPGLLLIEIGATGNTLEEAKYSAELLGNALVSVLTE